MNLIKKQLFRSINVIKHHWNFLVVEFDNDFDLMIFGKWILKIFMFIVFICYIPIVIVTMPLWLYIFKYNGYDWV